MLIGVIAEETLLPLVMDPPAWFDGGPLAQAFHQPDIFLQTRITIIGFLIPGLVDETDTVLGAENFLHTYVTNGYQGIFRDLIGDPDETFYGFGSGFQPVLQPPPGIDTDFFYHPTIPVIPPLAPIGRFVDTDFFYVPILYQGLAPNLFFDADVIRAQVIRRDGDAAVLLSETFIDADAFFAPSLGRALTPALFNAADVIYAAVQGVSPLLPSAFIADDAFLAPFIANALRPSLVAADDTFIGPVVGTPGRVDLFLDGDIFLAPSVQLPPLRPSLVSDVDTFITSVIASNPAIYPFDPVIDFDDTFYTPIISQNLTLTPYLWIDVDDIKSIPYVILGQGLAPNLVDDSLLDAIPAVIADSIDGLAPGLFNDIDAFYTPFETSAHPLPPLVSDDALVETIYAPNVHAALAPSAYADSDTFYAPSLGSGIQPARISSASRAGLGSVIVSDDGSGKTRIIPQVGAVT